MAEKKEVEKIKTPRFRLSFESLFTPRAMEEGKDLKYSGVALWDKKTDLKKLKALAFKTGKEHFGKKWTSVDGKWPKGFKNPFRNGADKADLDGYGENVIFATLSANVDFPPTVFDKDVTRIDPTDPQARQIVYSGCWCEALVRFYPFERSGNKGVAIGLLGIQKVKDDEKFTGGGGATEDDFTAVEDESDDPDNHEDSEEDGPGF